MKKVYQSWGKYPPSSPKKIISLRWSCELPNLSEYEEPLLCYGLGRSYGDSCLNNDGILLDTAGMHHFLAFDPKTGLLTCEAGVSFEQILKIMVPRGWFLPVTPGTKYVTVGGAIANDVHGKNHHCAGTFGRFVKAFELVRSDGSVHQCSETVNPALFRATIGGLGLTGIITRATFQLKPIENPYIKMESIRFHTLADFFELSQESEKAYEYSVAWIDATATRKQFGRGIFMRGNHLTDAENLAGNSVKNGTVTFPFEAPGWLLNYYAIKLFNNLYYRKNIKKHSQTIVHYEPFFYPLDHINQWNRMYGRRGFFQYQCVVPFAEGYEAISEILQRIARSGLASFLAVLKTFGNVPSPGLLSFPRPGVTLALDFPNHGEKTFKLFEELDKMVAEAGGALYPAKDARMSPEMFRVSFPKLSDYTQWIDLRFASDFSRRVGLTPKARTQLKPLTITQMNE